MVESHPIALSAAFPSASLLLIEEKNFGDAAHVRLRFCRAAARLPDRFAGSRLSISMGARSRFAR
jgi:hypothetical protein